MDAIDVLKAENLTQARGVTHGFFTRQGGVSTGVYTSLNCSHGSSDTPDKVTENRSRAMRALGLGSSTLYGVNQIHSAIVHHIRPGMDTAYKRGDALVANEAGVALSVLGADCAPILFCDDRNRVIAAAHSGWKGALGGVVESTLDAMLRLGAEKQYISVAIGPTIAQQSYEVKEDFIGQLSARYRGNTDAFILSRGSSYYFDLSTFIRHQFLMVGVEVIEQFDIDTYSDERFYSYRRTTQESKYDYGRHISIISLTD